MTRDGPEDVTTFVIVNDRDTQRGNEYARRHDLPLESVIAGDVTEQLGIEDTPAAFVFDANSLLLNKGVVNSLEQMEVLIEEARLGLEALRNGRQESAPPDDLTVTNGAEAVVFVAERHSPERIGG